MRRSLILALLFTPTSAIAQGFKMEPGPLAPAEALKTIKARPGFKVELMVAEPLVMSPIAFAWGPDGKFWVVEMGDYPLGLDGKGKPGGKIKFLEKSKPDGPYDKMTLFMDGLGFPTGVFPYKNGVLVTCAPDIFYAEMSKDGKIKKEVLFTGFREGNQQHRVNGLTWGIDNWIYGANGDSGGIVKTIATGKSVNISGRDFRFKPDTGEFETVSGQSQFGRCRDDWGNWFGNNNSNPMYHYVLEDRYLKRNPHVLYPDVKVQVPIIPGAQPVYPISKPLPRFNSPQALNHFTSACSTIIYRDTLFGKEFEGNMFVSEPVHNLVHREIMKPKGITFTSQRADDEQTSEFLASKDNWFRPTMIQVGPDGALWIADMYRYVIEHPEWIPKDWQKKLDLRAGQDKGRIYRVYPADKKPREIVRMDKMKVKELVKQLDSESGWVRDTAHRMLAGIDITKKKEADKAVQACRALLEIMDKGQSAKARLHAAYAYGEIRSMPLVQIESLLDDPHPVLRSHGIALMGPFNLVATNKRLASLQEDSDLQVRLQLAYLLGRAIREDESNHKILARLIRENAQDRYLLAAALSSVNANNWETVFTEALREQQLAAPLVGPFMNMAKALGRPGDFSRLLVRQLNAPAMSASAQMSYVVEMLDSMERSGTPLRKFLQDAGDPDVEKTRAKLQRIHADALAILDNPKSAMSERMLAIRLLGRGLGDDRADHKLLLTFLTPRTPDDVQSAVIQQIGGYFDPRVPGLLLTPWKSYSPALRGQVLDTLLSRQMWAKMTLDAIKRKDIPAQEIDAVRRQRLLLHKNAQIREAAAEIFKVASDSNRGKIVDLYFLQLPEKADAQRGAQLFQKSCAACHKLGGVGQNVGPDLASVGDKSVSGLLTAILDPNKAVEARYVNYVASTKKGLTYSGILSAETSTTITLTAADGKEHQLLRNELDELSSTGKSLMPDGLEKDLSPQDVADIIAFVRNQGANAPKRLPGKEGRAPWSPSPPRLAFAPPLAIAKLSARAAPPVVPKSPATKTP